MKRRIIAGAVFLALLAALVVRAGYVLPPERSTFGGGWSMYLQERRDSIDVLFLGSSVAYCDVVPAELYARTGLTSFVMAGPEQTFSITYDYLREALLTQSPSAVFLEVSAVAFGRYMGFTKANISPMPWSAARIDATLRGAERSEWAGLFFPLYNYHDRFGDPLVLFRPRADAIPDPLAGFTAMTGADPQETRGERACDTSEDDLERNCADLGRIRDLCAQRGIKLVLFQAPSCGYLPEEYLDRVRDAVPDVELIDFNEDFEATGLDMQSDFYDYLHTNVAGARKFTGFLAERLSEELPAGRSVHDAELWAARVAEIEKLSPQS